ncbi:FlgB family protein [Ruegeria sediminis]|uniref:FlgB family protein n=1 Tax=Ruegeria sediminis TaxID=2583820 RepID=A0ABY2WWH0_9RHOB|nr:FlgB family protein [Ruegeria sediminis]TMV07105.1 FlgB family protein [Ruegeria sediminis]
MFSDLNVFKMAYAMATHAGQRQAVIARNMANADTPGYRARDIAGFGSAYSDSLGAEMAATREGHLNRAAQGARGWDDFPVASRQDPNGNSVSLEEQMLKAVEVKRQHDRALAIYRSSLGVLRASLGKA